MENRLLIFLGLFIHFSSCIFLQQPVHAQDINTNWERDLNNALQSFRTCKNTPINGLNPCNRFLGESLTTVYKINDFYSNTKKRQMRVIEISKFLKESDQWEFLGYAYQQEALTKSQEYANAKKAAIAIYLDPQENIGNISIILPGELKASGSWGFFKVPNSSSFLLSSPSNSYVGKALSYGYRKSAIKHILLYGRKY